MAENDDMLFDEFIKGIIRRGEKKLEYNTEGLLGFQDKLEGLNSDEIKNLLEQEPTQILMSLYEAAEERFEFEVLRITKQILVERGEMHY